LSLRSGVLAELAIMTFLTACLLYYMNQIRNKKIDPKIRPIAAMDAIEEGVGRAAEMGRPVHYCPGDVGRLSGEFGPAVIASLNLYKYTVGLCAKYDIPIFTSIGSHPEVIPLTEALTEDAYKEVGKPELYNPNNILFYGSSANKVARCGTVIKNNVALNVQAGVFYTEIQSHAVANMIGALNIGGSTRMAAAYGQAISCDYLFIIEDVLAAGAKCSGEPTSVSSIVAEDVVKWLIIGIGVIGILFGLANSNWFTSLLKL
jgi:hypothetical protein